MKKTPVFRMLRSDMNDFYSSQELYALCREQLFAKAKRMDVSLLRETLRSIDDRPDDEVAPHMDFVWNKIQRRIHEPTKRTIVGRRMIAIVLTVVLLMMAVTALAIALLSMRNIVEDYAVPIGQETDFSRFTASETELLLQLAEENGIEFSSDVQAYADSVRENGDGYFKDELIYNLAQTEFGRDMRQWSQDEQQWFSAALQATGSYDSMTEIWLPENDTEKAEAEIAAKEYVWRHYRADALLNDSSRYCPFVQCFYGHPNNPITGVYWVVTFFPTDPNRDDQYIIRLHDDLTVFDVIHSSGASVRKNEKND